MITVEDVEQTSDYCRQLVEVIREFVRKEFRSKILWPIDGSPTPLRRITEATQDLSPPESCEQVLVSLRGLVNALTYFGVDEHSTHGFVAKHLQACVLDNLSQRDFLKRLDNYNFPRQLDNERELLIEDCFVVCSAGLLEKIFKADTRTIKKNFGATVIRGSKCLRISKQAILQHALTELRNLVRKWNSDEAANILGRLGQKFDLPESRIISHDD